jgi:hypothetical protein
MYSAAGDYTCQGSRQMAGRERFVEKKDEHFWNAAAAEKKDEHFWNKAGGHPAGGHPAKKCPPGHKC